MNHRAFTFTEVLVTVAVIAVVAATAHLILGDVTTAVREQRATSDIDTLNRAVKIYLANGGNLDEADEIGEVLARLKSRVSGDEIDQSVGLTSQLIDPRLSTRTVQRPNGAQTVVWNAEDLRFEFGQSDSSEVTEIFLDDGIAENEGETDERSLAMKYASDSGWIWDYEDRTPANTNVGPTPITLVPDTSSPSTPSGTPTTGTPPSPPPAPAPPSMGTLLPPRTSVPAGTYPIFDYDLAVSLTDPNPAGSAQMVYSLDFGAWINYTGTIIVPEGSTLSVQSLALASEWNDSRKVDYAYEASPAQLAPPRILASRNQFGYFFGRTISVTLANPNPAGSSDLVFRLDGGPWQPYAGSFDLKRDDYPAGVRIEARAESSDSPYWSPSSTSSHALSVAPVDLAGNTNGAFTNPIGPAGMITNLTESGLGSSSYFDWGDDVRRKDDNMGQLKRSSLQFNGLAFTDIVEGNRFQVGSLDYFNGSIYSDTGANAVTFGINVAMAADGVAFGTTFNFDFELINTVNLEDPQDPWPDADFVRLANPTSRERLYIGDREYEFQLEFGETTNKGFALFDEFHVLEWSNASVNVYGTFSEVPSSSP